MLVKRFIVSKVLLAFCLFTLLCLSSQAGLPAGPVLVDKNAPGPLHDGITWATAYTSIQTAINDAVTSSIPEVWVADGVYNEKIDMSSGIAVYAGFEGYGGLEEIELSQRDWKKNVTSIDATSASPRYHVVTMNAVSESILDGFFITGGYANGGGNDDYGAGIFCSDLTDTNTITNCNIFSNQAYWGGGGIYCYNSSSLVMITNTIISNNTSSRGGGVYCYLSSPSITNCTISDNTAGALVGGGVLCESNSDPIITNTIFTGNTHHAIFEATTDSDPIVQYCLFYNNPNGDYYDENDTILTGAIAINGIPDGMASNNVDTPPLFIMDVSPISGDWEAVSYNTTDNTTLLVDNETTFTKGALIGKVINTDISQFNQALIIDNGNTTVTVSGDVTGFTNTNDVYQIIDYHLFSICSDAVDAGTTVSLDKDIEGNPRPVDLKGIGQPFDIGAYELQIDTSYTNIRVVGGPFNFGTQLVNQGPTASNSVTIWNQGGTLEILSLSLIGTDPADFVIDDDSGENPIPECGFRTVDITFDPSSVGAKSAELEILSNDPAEPIITVALSGVGENTKPIAGINAAKKALGFDGKNDRVDIPRPIQDDFTIEFWFKSTQMDGNETHWFQGQGLVDAKVDGNTDCFGTALGNGKVLFGTGKPNTTIKSGVVADGFWHHVAAVRTKATGSLKLYIDGVLVASGTGGTQSLNASSGMAIGCLYGKKSFFDGTIDEVRIWNVPRSPTDIQAYYWKSLTGNEAGLVAYYRLDEGSGTTAHDSTANGNNGTLVNGPIWVDSTAPILIDDVYLSTDEDTQLVITAGGWDREEDTLFSWITQIPITGTGELYQYEDPGVPGSIINTVPTLLTDPELRVIFIPDDEINDYESIFRWKVFDGTLYSDNTATMTISVDCEIDEVALIKHSLTVDEGASKILSDAELFVQGDWPVEYRIDSLPANGILAFDSTPLAVGDTFTQLDVRSGLIGYSHDGSESPTDSFAFSFKDVDSSWVIDNTFNITINPINDPPTLVNHSLQTQIGLTEIIIGDNLLVTDPENDTITYRVDSLPIHGELKVNGLVPDPGNTFFTQDAVTSGLIQYTHDGTATTTDSFTFSYRDNDPSFYTDNIFSITILLENTPPILNANNGIRVDEGGTTTVLQYNLETIDSEDGPKRITYTLTEIPVNGELKKTGVVLGVSDTFTQNDINTGQLTYTHDGSETTADSFKVDVSDRFGAIINDIIVSITINPVNDVPQVVTNTGINLDEGATKGILQSNLEVTDIEDGPDAIIYTLVEVPSHGILTNDTTQLDVGGTLTQSDINAGLLSYTHDGNETTDDSFKFDVNDSLGAGIDDVVFLITINPIDDPAVLVNHSLKTQTGMADFILSANLLVTDEENDPITYRVDSYPLNGDLLFDGNPIVPGVVYFTPEDVNNNRLQYVHDGSETTDDSFLFSYKEDDAPFVENNVFTITISLENTPPELITNTGATVNEGGTVTILKTNLETTDAESGPERITYTLTQIPANGTLKNSGSSLGIGGTFTQYDINTNLVAYTHNGSETTADSFKFNITDRFGAAINDVTFAITINLTNDTPVLTKNTGISVAQGEEIIIANSNLQATDDDNTPAQLTYTIQTFPTNGVLNLNGVPLSPAQNTFTQADINAGILTYTHNGNTAKTDFFIFTVSDPLSASIPATQFDITIFVKTGRWILLR